MNLSVAALVATYRRPRELARLLDSLAMIERGLTTVIVVDNGASAETEAVVNAARCPAQYVNAGRNLGCGGGLRLAGERALADARVTHLLILDDDAILPPETLTQLGAALEREHADLAYPLVVDEGGRIGWLPGFPRSARELRHAEGLTPEIFRARFGNEPREFIWAQGICLLVTRRAVEAAGLHRDDFWVRGEDLDFSLRLTARGRGIHVSGIVVQHLPSADGDATVSGAGTFLKHCAMLQNIAYLALRQPHGRRIAWTLGPNLRRFLRLWSWRALGDALRAFWRGVVRAEPAGRGTGETFRARFEKLPRA
jgi:GT2 family glycosyltransferase